MIGGQEVFRYFNIVAATGDYVLFTCTMHVSYWLLKTLAKYQSPIGLNRVELTHLYKEDKKLPNWCHCDCVYVEKNSSEAKVMRAKRVSPPQLKGLVGP